jgi:hypothetical protein
MNLSSLISNVLATLQLGGSAVSNTNPLPVTEGHAIYTAGDTRQIPAVSTLGILFSDDFGGTSLNTTNNWDVIDGGLAANPTLHGKTITQGAIGTGINMGNGNDGPTNSALSVNNSALTVTMGTTPNAELWLLSQQVFSCSEDVTIILSKSQNLTQNSIWAQMVEVDPATYIPLLNPYLANDFTNRAGMEFGITTSNTTCTLQALGDSSPISASTNGSFPPTNTQTSFETTIEYHAEDIIASAATPDAVGGKLPTALRLSTQVPNDNRAYKLLLRFRNIGTPASSTTVTIPRIVVVDGQEMRVEVSSGRGDQNAQKGIAVNPAGGSMAVTQSGTWNIACAQGFTESTTTLGASSSFTGTAYADQAGTVQIQQSLDSGATWQVISSAAVAAATAVPVSVRLTGIFNGTVQYKVVYNNGSTAQGTFRLSSSFSLN